MDEQEKRLEETLLLTATKFFFQTEDTQEDWESLERLSAKKR